MRLAIQQRWQSSNSGKATKRHLKGSNVSAAQRRKLAAALARRRNGTVAKSGEGGGTRWRLAGSSS